MDRKRAERLLMLVCLGTAVMGVSGYVLLRSIPSVRAGITLTVFGSGLVLLAWTGLKTGVMGWRLGAVARADEPMFFRILVVSEFITGFATICLGWFIQLHIVNAPPRPNPLPPEHPDYEYYSR
jgi:hypothetical protein